MSPGMQVEFNAYMKHTIISQKMYLRDSTTEKQEAVFVV